ncbi:MAG: hypothetical protein ACR2OV_03395 [Hyphomicrobiaceae bacterium]
MPQQLVFDLPHRSAQGADDFLVSASNQAAVDLIDAWPEWPAPASIITGPPGVGKTHLVNVWAERSHAKRMSAIDLTPEHAREVQTILIDGGTLAVEDIDRGVGSESDLFHLLNLAREHGRSLLLTTRLAPGELGLQLADLSSRLRALPLAQIDAPDDRLLQALLVKLFNDRQLRVEPATVSYILTHMERSAESAARIVAEIDRLALTTHRRATKLLAREVIYNLFPIKH